jgi:hypothetical protein
MSQSVLILFPTCSVGEPQEMFEFNQQMLCYNVNDRPHPNAEICVMTVEGLNMCEYKTKRLIHTNCQKNKIKLTGYMLQ